VSYIPKKNKSVVLLSTLHHDSAICSDSGKREIIEFYNKRYSRHVGSNVCKVHSTASNSQMDNGNVLWHDQHCCSKYIGHAHNMRKDQPEKKIKRKDFLLRIAHDLVTPFVTQRYKLPTLPRNIKTAIVMCEFVSDSEDNTMQDPEDYEAISRKRGRCHVCSRRRDVKTQFVCKGCGHYVCKDHTSMIVTCDTCKKKDETD
jgi:hypothetical protein